MLVSITYTVYSLALFFWSVCSIQYEGVAPMIRYLGAIALLCVFVWSVWIIDEKKQTYQGVLFLSVFTNLGLAVAYRCTSNEAQAFHFSDFNNTYAGQTLIMTAIFISMFCLVRFTRIYKTKVWNLAAGVGILVVTYGARLTGERIGGSYLYFQKIMVFSCVISLFPFIASYFLSRKEEAYVKGNVKYISWNLCILLLYTCSLYLASALNKEYGLVFIIGAVTCVLFYLRCKSLLLKLFYTGVCTAAALIAGEFVHHIRDRVQLWFHPELAKKTEMMKAESVLYIFRYIKNIGWYSRGIGNLSSKRIPTLRSDHVILTILNDYSFLLLCLILLLSVLLVRYLLICPRLDLYDYYLDLSIALTIGFMILLDIGSVSGSFIQAGIGFPWISMGGNNNLALTALLATHCGIAAKGDDTT